MPFATPCSTLPMRTRLSLGLALAALLMAGTAVAQTWNETGDAGQLPGTAQITLGAGALTMINGTLGSASDVDMFCIKIMNRTAFSARLACVVAGGPHVWLFDATGKGVAANSQCLGGGKVLSGTFVLTTGTYYIAVAYDGVLPTAGPNAIWLQAFSNERAPDGPGSASAITGWSGTGNVQPLNPYVITLLATTVCDSPVPAHGSSWGTLKLRYE